MSTHKPEFKSRSKSLAKIHPAFAFLTSSTRHMLRSFGEIFQLATLLAFVAGIVNSSAFLEFGTFVSHISGHATRSAVDFMDGKLLTAALFLLETLVFILGAMLAAILLRGYTVDSQKVKFTSPILIEATLLLCFLVLNTLYNQGWLVWGDASMSTLLLAFAMGMQNALLRQSSGAIIRTTHMTGVATDIGFELGHALRASSSYLRERIHRSPAVWRGAVRCFVETLGLGRFSLQFGLFTAFTLGAGVGTVSYHRYGRLTLLLPITMLTLLALREYWRPQIAPSTSTKEP